MSLPWSVDEGDGPPSEWPSVSQPSGSLLWPSPASPASLPWQVQGREAGEQVGSFRQAPAGSRDRTANTS